MTDAPEIAAEAARRRAFAIISHPDAGKTTLTENLLLSAGAIRLAGAVRARGEQRRATSDWMKIERERGISVSASVMTFDHRALVFNLLDTPGHEDFSEDTYRTLTAADSAVMVLDAAKGVEPQTLKLFEVCRLRDIPITTFINKMDREARDPFELIEEIQETLALDAAPMQWPAGSGGRFAGLKDLSTDEFMVYSRDEDRDAGAPADRIPASGNSIRETLDDAVYEEMEEGALLAQDGYSQFDLQAYREGHLTPVYFGSALRGFGVRELLDALADIAPQPAPVKAQTKEGETTIQPGDSEVSGFVFKIQANMDPNHRDRVAFLRLTSGKFERGQRLKTATGKPVPVHSPVSFFAHTRETTDIAYAGDVIGVPNHGLLRVGDSLSQSGKYEFSGLPNFAPEMLRRVRVTDPLKQKHLKKALEGLSEEGVTQLFRPIIGADFIVGAVGQLQLEVMAERLSSEYNLDVVFEPSPYETARWVAGDEKEIDRLGEQRKMQMAEDIDAAPVFLAKSEWEAGYVQEKFPDLRFLKVRERN
ncbi:MULTISPECIES: peptide chain release factor 3 [Euryhalocaulis]|uniref:peptide chain release factor 3 n=1 Tax=Euryhalocaulis TaxID=1712422 RepID=UPI0003A8E6CA|nr:MULTISPECIES: peptide chain release factor 3 [Euryhalocaulis]MBA4802678.1 peptide chain release factor 3 [Euryhalocaulis sp.]